MYNQKFMDEAVALAGKCFETGFGGPFGAVIVKDGVVIGRGSNSVTSLNDPTAHAEVMAIREACSTLKTFQLTDCELYTSCEPCPMCLGAIYWARPKAIYYGASRVDAAHAGFDDSLIYDELALPTKHRKIPTEQHHSDAATQVFEKWKNWDAKTKY